MSATIHIYIRQLRNSTSLAGLMPKSLHLARQCRRCMSAITLPPVGPVRPVGLLAPPDNFNFPSPFSGLASKYILFLYPIFFYIYFACQQIKIDAQHARQ